VQFSANGVGTSSRSRTRWTGWPATLIEISAHAQTWENVAKHTLDAQKYYSDAIKAETAEWVGASGDAYREHAGTHLNVMEGISKAAHGIHYGAMGAGLIVGLVRGIVRDLIAQFIATSAARLPQWLAEVGLTLGIGTPWVIRQVSALVGSTRSRDSSGPC
jgi:hypothetical protein